MWSLLTTKPPHRYRAGRDTSRSRLVSHGPAIGRVSLALGLPLVLGIQDIEILTIKPLLIVLKIGVLPSIVSSRNLLGIFIKKHSFFLSPYMGSCHFVLEPIPEFSDVLTLCCSQGMFWLCYSGWWLTYPSEKYESQWEG